MVKKSHRLRKRVAGTGKTAGNSNARAMEGGFRDAKLFKEAMKVTRSVWRKDEKPSVRGNIPFELGVVSIMEGDKKALEFALENRIYRDCERLAALSGSEMKPFIVKVNVSGKKRRFR